jgi:hypothetical protein
MLFLLACGETGPLYSADNLSEDIEGYEEWVQPVGWMGAVPSCDSTHGPFVEIWFNAVAAEAIGKAETEMPEGAAIVKQAFEEDKESKTVLSAMRKVPGFAPETGDWFWGQFAADGTELSSGDLSGCTGCHAAGTDFVMFIGSEAVSDPSECP